MHRHQRQATESIQPSKPRTDTSVANETCKQRQDPRSILVRLSLLDKCAVPVQTKNRSRTAGLQERVEEDQATGPRVRQGCRLLKDAAHDQPLARLDQKGTFSPAHLLPWAIEHGEQLGDAEGRQLYGVRERKWVRAFGFALEAKRAALQ